MFDEKNQDQVVEETLEASEIQNVEKASDEEASTTMADKVLKLMFGPYKILIYTLTGKVRLESLSLMNQEKI